MQNLRLPRMSGADVRPGAMMQQSNAVGNSASNEFMDGDEDEVDFTINLDSAEQRQSQIDD